MKEQDNAEILNALQEQLNGIQDQINSLQGEEYIDDEMVEEFAEDEPMELTEEEEEETSGGNGVPTDYPLYIGGRRTCNFGATILSAYTSGAIAIASKTIGYVIIKGIRAGTGTLTVKIRYSNRNSKNKKIYN